MWYATSNELQSDLGKDDYMKAMDTLFSKLDESIDDIENGRVISEEEMWAELDAV